MLKINWKQRLKNYGFWVSLFAFVPMALSVFGLDILPKNYGEITNALLSLLVLLGLVNNPTTEHKGFSDHTNIDNE